MTTLLGNRVAISPEAGLKKCEKQHEEGYDQADYDRQIGSHRGDYAFLERTLLNIVRGSESVRIGDSAARKSTAAVVDHCKSSSAIS